jgi:hypothetical protein
MKILIMYFSTFLLRLPHKIPASSLAFCSQTNIRYFLPLGRQTDNISDKVPRQEYTIFYVFTEKKCIGGKCLEIVYIDLFFPNWYSGGGVQ